MQYIQVSIPATVALIREELIAELDNIGYNGFEETDDQLLAYIDKDLFNDKQLQLILDRHSLTKTIENIAEQNWNTIWEENFQPVIVEDFCTVRADFHQLKISTPYEIVITPKMSFGTGHHATTRLMMMQMKGLDMREKKVLDFGTGTGILAILAEMLGAKQIVAIDNDEWSFENAKENIDRNNCKNIIMKQGSLEIVTGESFDIILANINRNILLMYVDYLYGSLVNGGKILMSGLLKEDIEVIKMAAEKAGLVLEKWNELNNWVVLLFIKK